MKIKIGEIKSTGLNQYADSFGRTIIADKKNHIAYVVEKSDEKRYQVYSSRFVLAFIAGLFAGYFINWYVGVFIGVLAALFLQLTYKSRFLPSLPMVGNVDFPKSQSLRERMLADDNPGKIMGLLISSALIPVFSVIFIYQTFPGLKIDLAAATLENKILLFLLPALSVFCIYICIISIPVLKELKARRTAEK